MQCMGIATWLFDSWECTYMYERCAHAHYRPRITSIFMNKYGAQICILSQLLMEH
jgi:hypothetical protein